MACSKDPSDGAFAAVASPLRPFTLERFFAEYEFSAPHLLCCSDCEPVSMREVLQADDELRARFEALSLGYTESAGCDELRGFIAELYEGLGPEHCFVTAPAEGITLAVQAIVSPGDHVVVQWPCYQSLFEIARSLGAHVEAWEPDSDLQFCPASLGKLVRPGQTKLVVINSPHNPTGFVFQQPEMEQIISIVQQADSFLLSDEMYRGLELKQASTASACEMYSKALTLSGLSKAYGMPGLRIGWLATKDAAVMTRIAELKDYTTICPPAPCEILALIALKHRAIFLARCQELLAKNIVVLEAFMAKHSDRFVFVAPRGGSVCLVRLGPSSGCDAETYCTSLVKKHGVLLAPGLHFGAGPDSFRIGFGRRNFEQVLQVWEKTFEDASAS